VKRFLENYEPAIAAAVATLFVAVVDALFIMSAVLPISLFVLIPWADPLNSQWYIILLVACLSLLLYYCVGRIVRRLLMKHFWQVHAASGPSSQPSNPAKLRRILVVLMIFIVFIVGQACGVLLWLFSDASMTKMMSVEGTLLLTGITLVPYLLGGLGVWKKKKKKD
jgi:hypothetical protein